MKILRTSAKWKKALKAIAAALVSVVVLDWLFKGRLRQRLRFQRRATPKQPPII